MTWAEIASSIIAACALGFTAYQAYLTRHHHKISVAPRLTTWVQFPDSHGVFSIELMNKGIGPAIIKSFELAVDGKQIQGRKTEKIDKALKILFPKESYTSTSSFLDDGYAMAAKDGLTLASLKFSLGVALTSEEFERRLERVSLTIKFDSMYGETFQYQAKGMESTHTKI